MLCVRVQNSEELGASSAEKLGRGCITAKQPQRGSRGPGMVRGQGGHTRVAESRLNRNALGKSEQVIGTEHLDPRSTFYSDNEHREKLYGTHRQNRETSLTHLL